MVLLTKMSHSAMVSKLVCLYQPFELNNKCQGCGLTRGEHGKIVSLKN